MLLLVITKRFQDGWQQYTVCPVAKHKIISLGFSDPAYEIYILFPVNCGETHSSHYCIHVFRLPSVRSVLLTVMRSLCCQASAAAVDATLYVANVSEER